MLYRNQFTSYSKAKLEQERKNSFNDRNLQPTFQRDSFNNHSQPIKEDQQFQRQKDNVEIEKFLQKLMNSNSENLNNNIQDLLKEEKPVSSKTKMDLKYYNLNWEEDFRKQGLSLEDDGIYEYIDGDDKMALEYFNGELPKTKITKNRSKTRSGAEVRDKQKAFNDELVHLKTESAVVQKAWLANNKRINELIDVVEAQERELKQLRGTNPINNNANISNYERLLERVERLEHNNDFGSSAEDQASLEKLKKENQKLRELLQAKEQSNTIGESMAPSSVSVSVNPTRNLEQRQFKKRKQAHFFVLKEHEAPKITKLDLDHKRK